MKITLCQSCTLGAGGFAAVLRAALAQEGISATVGAVDCMSGCARPSSVAFRAPGKVAFLFGDMSEADLAELVSFARAYAGSPDGVFADARRFGALRHKVIARIPG